MAKRAENEYIFADAYIGSFSKNLMTKKDFMRVATSKDLDSAETILREYGYGEADELKVGDIEAFIRREQNRLFDLIYDTLPERAELGFYLYPFDYHNVKVCLKAEILGLTPDSNYLVSTGSIDWMKIVSMVRDRNYAFMPVQMKHGIIEAMDRYSKSQDPQDIDIILDKACHKHMIEDAEATEEEFLIGMVRTKIDTLNISSFVRLKQLKKSIDFFKYVFLEGGNIPLDLLMGAYEDPYARVGEKLEAYGYKEVFVKGGKVLQDTGDYSLFEKLRDDKIMEWNKQAKYESFGIVPIAGYWYAKELEIDNLRITLTGKLFGFAPEEIEERLREPYV